MLPQGKYPKCYSSSQISCRNYRCIQRLPPGGSTVHISHSQDQLSAINDLAGKYTHRGTIQSPSGEEGCKYMIFTGKYGNINFKMKITYYPTLPWEYHIARFPKLSRLEGSIWKLALGGYLKRTENNILTCRASYADRRDDERHVQSVYSVKELHILIPWFHRRRCT